MRLAPFYDVKAVSAFLKKCAADINADLSSIENPAVRGPHSKYTLPLENKSGRVEFTCSEGENGVACSLDSPGHKAINAATLAVLGEAKPYSIGGSLPLICELKHQVSKSNKFYLFSFLFITCYHLFKFRPFVLLSHALHV